MPISAQIRKMLRGSRKLASQLILFSVLPACWGDDGDCSAGPPPHTMAANLQPPLVQLPKWRLISQSLLVVITAISLFFFGLLIYFGVRFRASQNPKASKHRTTQSLKSYGR
ncbi:MAG: hypothetical protein CM15mP46_2430 [Alphaproteobacteria bacterium]|nr:MAG: hypothetical protein CM15mP46_2430 [Alphaproteobacteria bacterium]